MGLTISPLYSAELSPAKVRGALMSSQEIAINVGILLGYVAGYSFAKSLSPSIAWRAMLGVGGLPPFFIMIALIYMPESPRYGFLLQGEGKGK